MKMNHNTIGIYHIHVCSMLHTSQKISLESFQTRETWGKWVLAKWVEKVGLAFGGKL